MQTIYEEDFMYHPLHSTYTAFSYKACSIARLSWHFAPKDYLKKHRLTLLQLLAATPRAAYVTIITEIL